MNREDSKKPLKFYCEDLTGIGLVCFSVMKKRRADEMSDEVPSAKMRRLVGLSNENAASSSASATFASSYDDYVSGNIFWQRHQPCAVTI